MILTEVFFYVILASIQSTLKEVIGLTGEDLDTAISIATRYGFWSTRVTDAERAQIQTAATQAGERGIRAGKAMVAPVKE